jgi:hypothetical protein
MHRRTPGGPENGVPPPWNTHPTIERNEARVLTARTGEIDPSLVRLRLCDCSLALVVEGGNERRSGRGCTLAVDDQGPMVERECIVLPPQRHRSRFRTIIIKSNNGSNSEQQHAEAEEATGRAGRCPGFPSFPSFFPSLLAATVHQRRRRRTEHAHTEPGTRTPAEGRVRVVDPETTVACDSHPGAKWAPFILSGEGFFRSWDDVVRSSHKSCRPVVMSIIGPGRIGQRPSFVKPLSLDENKRK